MKEYFAATKQSIAPFLNEYITHQIALYKPVNRWSADALRRLRATASEGKMVRGGLVYMAYELAQKKPDETCQKLAAAIEIVHTALVIHDDIMDCDGLRRGQPTVYRQYQTLAHASKSKHADHLGESLGVCVGDVAIFLSFDLLASLPVSQAVLGQKLVQIFSQELCKVGFAQMQDVWAGSVSQSVTMAEILQLYRYKTARYTFSLPFMLGGIAAGLASDTVNSLAKLGEHIGIIFQIKDDELGMYGEQEKIGKPCGSDIREGKQTFYYYFLYKYATKAEQKLLGTIFGNPAAGKQQLMQVRELIVKYSVIEKIQVLLEKEIKEAKKIIAGLPFDSKQKQLLEDLLAFNLNRSA